MLDVSTSTSFVKYPLAKSCAALKWKCTASKPSDLSRPEYHPGGAALLVVTAGKLATETEVEEIIGQ
jgi:hypothetical protein